MIFGLDDVAIDPDVITSDQHSKYATDFTVETVEDCRPLHRRRAAGARHGEAARVLRLAGGLQLFHPPLGRLGEPAEEPLLLIVLARLALGVPLHAEHEVAVCCLDSLDHSVGCPGDRLDVAAQSVAALVVETSSRASRCGRARDGSLSLRGSSRRGWQKRRPLPASG